MKPDPMGESRNPLQVYLLCLCVLTGVSSLNPDTSTSDSMDSLNFHARAVWGIMIGSGGFVALLGMYWQGDARTGLVLKRLGFIGLVIPCLIFSVIVVRADGWEGLTVAATLLGFALACYLRARAVTKHIKKIIQLSP